MVVSDASPIINLAAVDELALLHMLYGTLHIPEAVHHEITRYPDQPGARETQTLGWIETHRCRRRDLVRALRGELDAGESEAIALAVEVNAERLLIDERAGRRAAGRLHVEHVGLLGVLIEAKSHGCLSAVRPLLTALRVKAGFWISDALEKRVLQQAGEGD